MKERVSKKERLMRNNADNLTESNQSTDFAVVTEPRAKNWGKTDEDELVKILNRNKSRTYR